MRPTSALLITGLFLLTACGGGSTGNPNFRVEGSQQPTLEPNYATRSTTESGSSMVLCRPVAVCYDYLFGFGDPYGHLLRSPFEADFQALGTVYETLGEWRDLRAVVHSRLEDGFQARYAVVEGNVHPNSLPPQMGSARWRGDITGLDTNNRLVRGEAELTIADLSDPMIDVRLTPQSGPVMSWSGLEVTIGSFAQWRPQSNYISGQFYGRQAGEVGGVFERNGIIGAFGAQRR